MSCPICGGLSALDGEWLRATGSAEVFVEGFFLGLIMERTARFNARHVSNLVCVEHLRMLRVLADKIPLEVVGPSHRHLLNLGLQAVEDSG